MKIFDNFFIQSRPDIDDNEKVKVLTDCLTEQAELYGVSVADTVTSNTLVIAVGGDGTFLAAAQLAFAQDATVTGFNLGRKGFLVDNDPADAFIFFADMVTGFKTRGLSTRSVLTLDGHIAINEFLVSPKVSGHSLANSAYVDGSMAIETIGSGMIVATPTGSTAFALSAGGPVIAPDTNSFVIAPVLPHTLASRPLIVNDCSVIEIETTRGDEVVFADGRIIVDSLRSGKLIITKASRPLKILQKSDWNFYDTLRNKMSWNK